MWVACMTIIITVDRIQAQQIKKLAQLWVK